MSIITSAQIRGARAMLDWSIVDLAKAASLSVSTIKRMGVGGPRAVSPEAQAAVRAALETAGIRFDAEAGRGQGVWLRQDQQRSHAR